MVTGGGRPEIVAMMRIPARFSLKTLLALVLACAVAGWAYWIAWPNWLAYQAGRDFEERAKTLRAGASQRLFDVLPHDGTLTSTHRFDAQGKEIEIYPFRYKYAWYCLYLRISPSSATPDSPLRQFRREQQWDEVRVYRLKPPLQAYRAQTAAGKEKPIRFNAGKSEKIERDYADQFLADFYEIAAGGEYARSESRDLGIEYELIHSDTRAETQKTKATTE
jgi:hypothetical protein